MLTYIFIFISQVLFNIFKTYEIKYTYENKIIPLLLNTVFINLVSISTTYFSIEGLLNGNYTVIIVYICGSVIGKWIAMTKIPNYRFKIFNFLKKQ